MSLQTLGLLKSFTILAAISLAPLPIKLAKPGSIIPSGTAIPVAFTHTIDAGKAKAGDAVTAKTLQVIKLPSGESIPKASEVLGHVVEARRLADQSHSVLAIRLEQIATKDGNIPVTVCVRALASRIASNDALMPNIPADAAGGNTRTQLGGDQLDPGDKHVYSSDGEDVVGENSRDGVFAKLVPAEYHDKYTHFSCGGTDTPQSVAIYSSHACGLYGFSGVYLTNTGDTDPKGTFTLDSKRQTVRLYGYSTALLQVIGGN